VKPNINSVEVHPQVSNNKHPVDGKLVAADVREKVYPSYSPAALFSIPPDSVAPCLGMRVVHSSIVVNLPNFIGPRLLVRTKEGRTTYSLGSSFWIYNTLMLEVVWSLDLFVRNR
jgi:hypothetical protein